MTLLLQERRFGNIPSQPRHRRRITCFWADDTKEWLPFIDPLKHRFTLYQAQLNSSQLKIIKNNDFTTQSCGLCGRIGHSRRSCWCMPHSTPVMSACFQQFSGDDETSVYVRCMFYYLGSTLSRITTNCWSSYVDSGGKIGIEYLYDVGDNNSITNIRALAYKTDKTNKMCRCRSCYDYYSSRIHLFPTHYQERFKLVTPIDTTQLQFLDDEELRNQLRQVEIKTDGQCPICMEEILNVDKVITKCGHVFCGSCLFQNLGTSTVCPMCRENLADFSPISKKITQLEEEVEVLRDELNSKTRLLRRVQHLIGENI